MHVYLFVIYFFCDQVFLFLGNLIIIFWINGCFIIVVK